MQPGAAPLLGRKDRHIRRSVVRMGANTSRHRVAFSLEEALRLVNLPGEDEGRVYHFRRLSVQGISADASRAVWIERLQEILTAQARQAVHASDARSLNGDAVFFHDEDEAFEVVLRSALSTDAKPAWFWQAAIGIETGPHRGANVAAILERIREQRSSQHAAAIILAALDGSGPAPLLSSLPAFIARDWVRTLEASGTTLTESPPMLLPEETATMLQSTGQQFGWGDDRTVWLATQAVLRASPPSQSSALSVKRARATLRFLESTRLPQFKADGDNTENRRVIGNATNLHTIVFDGDEDITTSSSHTQAAPNISAMPAAFETARDELRPQTSPHVAPVLRGEQTRFGGLYFLLHVLRQLGIVKALEACPALTEAGFVAHVIRKLATDADVADDDAILCVANLSLAQEPPFIVPPEALSTPAVWPGGFNASSHPDGDRLVRLWTVAVRRWCWRMGAIGVRDIVSRRGRVWLTRNDLDVTFKLSDADIRIRRLGLDVDPGWLPWLGPFGLVVRFHYQDRDPGGDSC